MKKLILFHSFLIIIALLNFSHAQQTTAIGVVYNPRNETGNYVPTYFTRRGQYAPNSPPLTHVRHNECRTSGTDRYIIQLNYL